MRAGEIWISGKDDKTDATAESDAGSLGRRVLFWQDGVVAEIWHEDIAACIGCVYQAKITRVFPQMNRATAEITPSDNNNNRNIDVSIRIGKRDQIVTGQLVRITITGAPRDGKAWQAVLGARLVSRNVVLLPDESGLFTSVSMRGELPASDRQTIEECLQSTGTSSGAILRRNAAGADCGALVAELTALMDLWASGFNPVTDTGVNDVGQFNTGLVHNAGGLVLLTKRHAPDQQITEQTADDFDAAYEDAIEAAMPAAVHLDGGGVIWIERTHALIAIDLDSGTGSLDALMREAPAVIARQLRLRSLTGLIAIDVPRASPAAARWFNDDLEQHFARDPRMPEILGRSRGGLLECRIAHGQPPLLDQLAPPYKNPTK